MTAAAKNKNTLYYINCVIFFIITFSGWVLPPFAQITEMGMKILGIFVGVVYGWLFLGLAWPSLFGLLALGLSGYVTSVNSIFVSGFSYQTLPQIVLSYVFAEAIAATGLTEFFTKKLMTMKGFAGKPYRLVFAIFMFMFVTVLCRAGLAILFLAWKMFRELAEQAGLEKRNPFCTLMVSSTMVIYIWSTLAFPFNAGVIMQIGYFNKGLPNIEVSMLGWLIIFSIFAVVYILIVMAIMKFIIRPDLSPLAGFGQHTGAEQKVTLTKENKIGFSMLILFMFMVFAPTFIPTTNVLGKVLSTFGLTGSLVTVLCILAILRKEDGNGFIEVQNVSQKGVIWDVVWLLIATEPLANAFNSGDCGIVTSITTFFMPILSSMGPTVFLILSAVILGLVTQVVHNLILIIVFVPILCPMYLQLGGDPLVMFFVLFISFNAAFSTPAASWSSALMFGESSGITKQMYVYGFMHFFLSLALALLMSPLAGFFLAL